MPSHTFNIHHITPPLHIRVYFLSQLPTTTSHTRNTHIYVFTPTPDHKKSQDLYAALARYLPPLLAFPLCLLGVLYLGIKARTELLFVVANFFVPPSLFFLSEPLEVA